MRARPARWTPRTRPRHSPCDSPRTPAERTQNAATGTWYRVASFRHVSTGVLARDETVNPEVAGSSPVEPAIQSISCEEGSGLGPLYLPRNLPRRIRFDDVEETLWMGKSRSKRRAKAKRQRQQDETVGRERFAAQLVPSSQPRKPPTLLTLSGVVSRDPGLDLEEFVQTRELGDALGQVLPRDDRISSVDAFGLVPGELHRS